jgi:spoIIIJ-associated protein
MRYIEETGKTVEEALELALEKAGIDRKDARFEILSDGLGKGPAKIRLYTDLEEVEAIEDVLNTFLEKLGTKGGVEIEAKKKKYLVNIQTRGFDSILIGKNGKTLEAIEYIITRILRKRFPEIQLEMDVAGYRKRRREFLINKAKAIARRVKETGREMRMDPLNPKERNIVRDALRKDKDIRVYSVRRNGEIILVVAPAKAKG